MREGPGRKLENTESPSTKVLRRAGVFEAHGEGASVAEAE